MAEDSVKEVELPSEEELVRFAKLLESGHLVVFKYADRVDVRKDLTLLGKPPCIEDYSEPWDDIAFNIIKKLKTEVLENFNIHDYHFSTMIDKELCDRKGIEHKSQSGWHFAGKEEFMNFIRLIGDIVPYKIIVNAKEQIWPEKRISYREIINLARGSYDENIVYTVTFGTGSWSHTHRSGSLTKGDSTDVQNGMIFNVSITNNA